MANAPAWSIALLNRRGEMLRVLADVGYPFARLQAMPDAELEKLMAQLRTPGDPPPSDSGAPPRTEP